MHNTNIHQQLLFKGIIRKSCMFIIALTLWGNVGCDSLVADQALVPVCANGKNTNCIYAADQEYPVVTLRNISLTDYARNNYEVNLLIRYPVGATGPLPVVFWNHGGSPSPNAGERSENWSMKLASAGYVVIHPVRTYISDPGPFMDECLLNGFTTPDECIYWVSQQRYGPENIHFLLAHLPEIEALDAALSGMLDSSRIVIAGHSAGTAVVLATAGAWQQWQPAAPRYNENDPAPMAFLATGVQGPMYAGYLTGFHSAGENGISEFSFSQLTRPFLFITGVGDMNGKPPEARTTAWLTSKPGNKVLVWDTNPEAVHETMDAQKCDTPVRQNHCEWIKATGLAFLDAVVRNSATAASWLKSNTLHVISNGEIELHRR